jgi:hypothetical protein
VGARNRRAAQALILRVRKSAWFVRARTLRQQSMFEHADALDFEILRGAHREQRETFVPLESAALPGRLQHAGFSGIELRKDDYQLLLRAVR